MVDIDTIDGPAVQTIIEALQADQTLIKMRIPARDFHHLTIITSTKQSGPDLYFQIDYPHGFKEAVRGLDEWQFRFEFTGPDRLPYSFKTLGGERDNKNVWVKFPEVIERQQKREDFRVSLPYGINIYLTAAEAPWKIRVENLSRGGALGVEKMTAKSKPLLEAGESIDDFQIRFPRARENKTITVLKAVVKRVDNDTNRKRRFYAFQFTELDKQAESLLIQRIYDLQREFLRRRLPIDA
jgi:c-di-GMP-binding flagellar brake protein YcgR